MSPIQKSLQYHPGKLSTLPLHCHCLLHMSRNTVHIAGSKMPQERTSKLRRSKGIPKVRQYVNQCLCDGSQERKENKEVHG